MLLSSSIAALVSSSEAACSLADSARDWLLAATCAEAAAVSLASVSSVVAISAKVLLVECVTHRA